MTSLPEDKSPTKSEGIKENLTFLTKVLRREVYREEGLLLKTWNFLKSFTVTKPARHLVMQMQIFCVYKPYKESISKEVNNGNDLNLHLHDQIVGWLRF